MRAATEHSTVAAQLARELGTGLAPGPSARVQGGCINDAFRWDSDSGPLFVKITAANGLALFESEAAGLEQLGKARAVRVPLVRAVGAIADSAYLALEWIVLTTADTAAQARLGEQLAHLHGVTAAKFGWHRDNSIGSTPQSNEGSSDWVEFFRERRLRYQLDLARLNGFGGELQEKGAQLLERMDCLFAGYRPRPSLLHGDLWSGNWGVDPNGQPVIFDPAVYFGDREADVAMTRLFGGFGDSFYRAYGSVCKLDAGAPARTELLNLYHVLNHLNIFGAGYLGQAESMLGRLLAIIR